MTPLSHGWKQHRGHSKSEASDGSNNMFDAWWISGWWFGTVEFYDFPYIYIYWEFHHPNWRTHIFQRGRSTTNQYMNFICISYACLCALYMHFTCMLFAFYMCCFNVNMLTKKGVHGETVHLLWWDVMDHNFSEPHMDCSYCVISIHNIYQCTTILCVFLIVLFLLWSPGHLQFGWNDIKCQMKRAPNILLGGSSAFFVKRPSHLSWWYPFISWANYHVGWFHMHFLILFAG